MGKGFLTHLRARARSGGGSGAGFTFQEGELGTLLGAVEETSAAIGLLTARPAARGGEVPEPREDTRKAVAPPRRQPRRQRTERHL
ncbi:hypothetical protein ACWGH2_11690 [Streptomyces sp. NPDC054871]